MFDRKEMATQLREAARELELTGDYSSAAFVRVQGVYKQLGSTLNTEQLTALLGAAVAQRDEALAAAGDAKEHGWMRNTIKCTACGFELPPGEYLNHRRHECPGSGQDALAEALASIALELEISNLFKHGNIEQVREAESRRR